MTASVTMSALQANNGVAGTEAYMSPEMLAVVALVKGGDVDGDQEVRLTVQFQFCTCIRLSARTNA